MESTGEHNHTPMAGIVYLRIFATDGASIFLSIGDTAVDNGSDGDVVATVSCCFSLNQSNPSASTSLGEVVRFVVERCLGTIISFTSIIRWLFLRYSSFKLPLLRRRACICRLEEGEKAVDAADDTTRNAPMVKDLKIENGIIDVILKEIKRKKEVCTYEIKLTSTRH